MVDISLAVSNVIVMKREDKFEEFWSLYPQPRRTGKALAYAKWRAIVGPTGLHTQAKDNSTGGYTPLHLSATPEEIIEGLKRACEQWRERGTGKYGWKDEGKFIPLPTTWLNQGRWLD